MWQIHRLYTAAPIAELAAAILETGEVPIPPSSVRLRSAAAHPLPPPPPPPTPPCPPTRPALPPRPPALRDRDGCAPQVWGCGNYWLRPMIAADSQGHYPLHQCAPPPQTQINTASLALCTTWCADLGFRVTTETRSSTAAGCPSRPSATCSRPGCRWCPSTPTAAPSGWCRGATRW